MSWKTAHRSFYYQDAPEPEDILLVPAATALLVIDIQNTYLEPKPDPADDARWQPFFERMRRDRDPEHRAADRGVPGARRRDHLRPRRLPQTGRPRPLAQPEEAGLQLPAAAEGPRRLPGRAGARARAGDMVITKTTDSALTGTNLRLMLRNMGIENVVVAAIFTDQCVSSTVRSLADESFNVVVVEACCAAATMELHRHELEVINMIYCHVATLDEVLSFFA